MCESKRVFPGSTRRKSADGGRLRREHVEDTKMRFSLTPQPGESGFIQWLDAMKMVARLQGGIPQEFRKRLWLTLAERHLEQRGVDWKQAEKICFNEWSNPDDEELGIQIVKDLHRTGCSLFCGAAGRDNQAVLRRVLLGFARWNKSVGYCQGLNVLAALVLQVMDRAESSAVKVMIYLIEGVLPEGYFADNLRGLSVDMAVFRDLLRARLPKLSKHLEALQSDAKDKATGSSYEPPLTNVFTMQWFLTLFCHCLPQEAVLRVWDLIFLEGDEVLLRTALAIWEGLSDRIMTVTSADEFYSIMGVLTREMLEFTDTNNLVKNIVSMGPLHGVTGLREKHRYNITPWARKLSDDEDSDTEEDERLAVAAAMFSMAQRLKKDRLPSTIGALQAMAPSNDRDRLALDISTLKQQYAKLRERQRQAHIILSAACARQSMVPPPASQAMNHLLVGKNALVSAKSRPLSLPSGTTPSKVRPTSLHSPRNQNRKDRQGVTLHWKDTKRTKQKSAESNDTVVSSAASLQSPQEAFGGLTSPKRADSDSDSTSTELCDEPDRLSDVDSEELTSASDSYVMATDEEKNPRIEVPAAQEKSPIRPSKEERDEPIRTTDAPLVVEPIVEEDRDDATNPTKISIANITDQIRRLSAEDEAKTMVSPLSKQIEEKSPEDFSISKSSSKRSEPIAQSIVDYTADTAKRSSRTLEDYDYLNFSSNALDTKQAEVLVHRAKEIVPDVVAESREPIQRDESIETLASTRRTGLESFPEYSSAPLDVNYDKIMMSLSPANGRFESSLSFSSNAASIANTYENLSKMDSLSNSSTEMLQAERAFYSKTYVIGHLPISPITVNQKLDKPSSLETNFVLERSPELCPSTEVILGASVFSDRSHIVQTKSYLDAAGKSPKTPESAKSFSSGETMGPDSKSPSLTVSPRTPVRSTSRDFPMDKSTCSSVSSESKTLVLRSMDSDIARESPRAESKKPSYEKSNPSTPISTDSLKNKSEASPKLVISSSSESCSPSKIKSSERSFSSDLQSPISANSIKYTSSYNKRGQDNISDSPIDLRAATSPFYPIAHPNQKTPSPYSLTKRRCSIDSVETSPEQKSSSSKESSKYASYHSKLDTSLKSLEIRELDSVSRRAETCARSQFNEESSSLSLKKSKDSPLESYKAASKEFYWKNSDFEEDTADDPSSEKDVVPSLPQEKLDKHYLNYSYRHRDRPKLLERSSSSLERRFADLKSSASTDEFTASIAKKRSSDILQDIKHLEAKAFSDGSPDTSMLTKKTSYIWEDLKNLEARRQDTFSNSARNFSKRRLEIPDISVTSNGRKTYVLHPRINIDENSDSILKSFSRIKDNGDLDDGRESKLGVWTKVKPRKRGNNGRRSSDRALKIIQENSAILHKILACQAKKRLPDLEEISKEITISPINEEISKIFSPILEKMGLNEHEINEELARINFKDFDNMTATSVSEFDAKINEELSKLSLIDDAEQVDQLGVDEVISHEYLDTREALIDRKINEELSKLLANYEEDSQHSMANLEKGSSSQNISEIEGLDLSSISTNVFSYKSSTDSIETRSDLGSGQEPIITTEKYPQYTENVLPYSTSRYEHDLAHKSDLDIYRELEKLDKISSAQILPDPPLEISQKQLSPIPYVPNTSPYSEIPASVRYPTKPAAYDTSPLKAPYDSYKPFDFKSRLSPRRTPTNPYTPVSHDKPSIESTFEFTEHKPSMSAEIHLKSPMLTKESLEFRVRYDDESPRQPSSEYLSLQKDTRQTLGASYFGNDHSKPVTPTKYGAKEDSGSFLEFLNKTSELLRRKYEPRSPKEYSLHETALPSTDSAADLGSYLPTRHRDYNVLSPSRQFGEQQYSSGTSHYGINLSPCSGDETKRPVSHPEFPGKVSPGKTAELPERGASCYKKSSLSLGNIGHNNKVLEEEYEVVSSPKTQFSPFPVRNTIRKPKELTLKLGLYSPKSSDPGQLKRS
ncbi:hypothetical protein KM043_012641 [Ampulex compressa]|nr:hypothetical protein KM043_012641 [Ampulex compressa]